jgi:hypothetical protein
MQLSENRRQDRRRSNQKGKIAKSEGEKAGNKDKAAESRRSVKICNRPPASASATVS